MLFHIEIAGKSGVSDPEAEQLRAALSDFSSIEDVRIVHIYLVDGELVESDAERIASDILTDPITQENRVGGSLFPEEESSWNVVTVYRKPGVMDPVEASALKAASDIGCDATAVRTGKKYLFKGNLSDEQLKTIATRHLANDVIEEVHFSAYSPTKIDLGAPYTFDKKIVPIRDVSDDELMQISKDYVLSLTLSEMKAIQGHYGTLDREPTDLELETVAQTWSEHCKHKTFSSAIDYNGERINSLIKDTIFKATNDLDRDWCVSVFKDNAGIIRFNDDYDVCFKVETHNHPSAIEPYGGASTGLGGVIRDVLGCGMGAKPIMSTDVFCVGEPDTTELPPGTIHPRRILEGVVAGVRDYGNRMGIPTVNGAVYVDPRYVGNPLVYCGCVGLLPKGMSEKAPKPGDLIVSIGGRTGRDGIHGATFSSVELTEESEMASGGAVQIGNAITEKKVLDVVLRARDEGLYNCITDCGAGGFSSAVGEMGEEIGADVELSSVPLKYDGLTYTEMWISEAQERMVLAVPADRYDRLVEICSEEDVEIASIGTYSDDGMLRVRYQGEIVGELTMEFLHDGNPDEVRKATWVAPELSEPEFEERSSYNDELLELLGTWNIASKHWIIRQYDHEVQGGSVAKSLVGKAQDGPGDAAVARPVADSTVGVAIGCGMTPRLGDLDPYHMATTAIDEAIRNVVAVGADPDRTAILDNFSWGNPHREEILGALVRASQGCHDAAIAMGTPFISGKDSMHNEFRVGDETITIPHTLLVSAIAIVPEVSHTTTMDLKGVGNALYLVGTTRNELGGSHYYMVKGELGANVPTVDAQEAVETFRGIHRAIRGELVLAAHDLSEGGLAVALAEMAFAGGVGAHVSLSDVARAEDVTRDDQVLFSETPSRFLVEVAPDRRADFEGALCGVPLAYIGDTVAEERVVVKGLGGATVIDQANKELKHAWLKPLDW
jgi:phosphoribosylformylglycinamidine synthase